MNTEQILKSNKNIDKTELAKAIKALQELRDTGAPKKGYDLVRPFSIAGARRQANRFRTKRC